MKENNRDFYETLLSICILLLQLCTDGKDLQIPVPTMDFILSPIIRGQKWKGELMMSYNSEEKDKSMELKDETKENIKKIRYT